MRPFLSILFLASALSACAQAEPREAAITDEGEARDATAPVAAAGDEGAREGEVPPAGDDASASIGGFVPLEVEVDDATGAVRFVDAPRIVGGERATFEEAPHQVALLIRRGNQRFLCGGSMIGDTWVLTAAHCVDELGGDASRIQVISGTASLNGGGKVSTATFVDFHPDYEQALAHDLDVALVKAELHPDAVPVERADAAATAALAATDVLVVTGYGATTEGGSSVAGLRKVSINFVPFTACTRSPVVNYRRSRISANMMCAGTAGRDSCQGDSGGPLFRDGDTPVQFGVVSWGDGCGRPGKFGVYAKAAAVEAWIDETIAAHDGEP